MYEPETFDLGMSHLLPWTQVYDPALGSLQDVVIPYGCVAVVPGYTLERATCGIFQAALHSVVCHIQLETQTPPCTLYVRPLALCFALAQLVR